MMYVHTLFIAITIFLMGFLHVTSATDLLNTTLGKRISLATSFFWLVRLYIQFFGFSSNLWKGKSLRDHHSYIVLDYLDLLYCNIYFGLFELEALKRQR